MKLTTMAKTLLIGLYRGSYGLAIAKQNRKRINRLEVEMRSQRRQIIWLHYRLDRLTKRPVRDKRSEIQAVKPIRN